MSDHPRNAQEFAKRLKSASRQTHEPLKLVETAFWKKHRRETAILAEKVRRAPLARDEKPLSENLATTPTQTPTPLPEDFTPKVIYLLMNILAKRGEANPTSTDGWIAARAKYSHLLPPRLAARAGPTTSASAAPRPLVAATANRIKESTTLQHLTEAVEPRSPSSFAELVANFRKPEMPWQRQAPSVAKRSSTVGASRLLEQRRPCPQNAQEFARRLKYGR